MVQHPEGLEPSAERLEGLVRNLVTSTLKELGGVALKPSEECGGNVTAQGTAVADTEDDAVEKSIKRARDNGQRASKDKKCGSNQTCKYVEAGITVGEAQPVPQSNPQKYTATSITTGKCGCE